MVSTYWSNEALKLLYKNNSNVNFYIGLSSTMPNADGSNLNEPFGGNYARMPIGAFNEPANGKITNSEMITFPTSTSIWFGSANKAAYYVIFDGHDSNAHVLGSGAFYAPMEVEDNSQVIIAPGLLSISLTGRKEAQCENQSN